MWNYTLLYIYIYIFATGNVYTVPTKNLFWNICINNENSFVSFLKFKITYLSGTRVTFIDEKYVAHDL